MDIFRANSEHLLYKKARSLEGAREGWLCIYINNAERMDFSDAARRRAQMDAMSAVMRNIMRQDEGYIYLCNDGDVFVLFRGFEQPVLERLSRYFGELKSKPDAKFHIVFDLVTDWGFFISLCESKADHAHLLRRQMEEGGLADDAPRVAPMPIAPKRAKRNRTLAMVEVLAVRRSFMSYISVRRQ